MVVYLSLQVLRDFCALKRNLHRSPSELREIQTKKLRAIIAHAYNNVWFYHKKLDEAGVKPDDIKTIEDLTKIPLSRRSEIQSKSLSELVAKNVDLNKCAKRTTSGSTGMPLTVAVDSKTLNFEEALWNRAFTENGLRFWDKMAVLHDPRSRVSTRESAIQQFGIMRRRYISIYENIEKQLEQIEDYTPQCLKGYSSSLAIFADFSKTQARHINPHLIFSGAEVLDGSTRKLISKAFDAEVFDNYGCNEFTLLAWECREHVGYHMNVDSVIMEFLDDGEPVSPGERGEVICTGLMNRAMPLIRYDMGDIGIPSQEQCVCGRALPIMKIVEGRVADFLLTPDGRVISPLIFFPYPFDDFEQIKQFRVIQEKEDKLVIQVVPKEGFQIDSETFKKATTEISRVFGSDMQVGFETLEKIEKDASGKIRKIVSHVPMKGHFKAVE